MSAQVLPGLAVGIRQLAVASLALNGCLSEMLRQAKAPFRPQDIGNVECCGMVDKAAWGNGSSLVVLVGLLGDGRRFELRGYLDDDAGLVTESSFRFLP
jgi:hypothetical protein